jgi:protease-4
MLSGSKDPDSITADEKKLVQDLIDETFTRFKDVVLEGRNRANSANEGGSQKGRKLASDWTIYADGRILSGSEAYRLGFVDQLGDFDTAIAAAERLGGVGKCKLVEYRARVDIADLFRLFGQSESRAQTVKIDLGLQPPKLQAGKLYFLSPNFLQ